MLRSSSSIGNGRPYAKPRSPQQSRALLIAFIVAGFGAAVALEVMGMNQQLVGFAAALIVAGFAIAAIAWISGVKKSEREITSWDLAGAMTFVGFAAAIIAN